MVLSESSRALASARYIFNTWKSQKTLESRIFSNLKIIDASPGRVVCSLVLQDFHLNRTGTMHGGAIAALVDTVGSLAVGSNGYKMTGVSTDINSTYMSDAGRLGEEVRLEGLCDKQGRTMAFTRVNIYNHAGKLAARGSHTKFLKQMPKFEDSELEGVIDD